jgi:hypothetical protein
MRFLILIIAFFIHPTFAILLALWFILRAIR